jgi:DNA polymerase-3 subunit gamma/tau
MPSGDSAPASRGSLAPEPATGVAAQEVCASRVSAATAPTRGEPVTLRNAEEWLAMVSRAGLKGPVRELAAHSAFCGHTGGVLQLSLPDSFDHLRSDNLVRQLATALAVELGGSPQIRFESARAAASETLHSRTERERGERQAGAEQAFLADPVIARLVQQGGTVVADSIRPLDDH